MSAHGGEKMARLSQHWRLVGLVILAVILTSGCNLASMIYFLGTGFQEPMNEPGEMKLATGDKEVKVVILIYTGQVQMRPEFITLDRELTNLLTRKLQESCKDNKEKVTFISPLKVQEYKNNNPNWFLKPQAVGEHFHADKVVYLEIESLSLYENGSYNQIYHGKAAISLKLFDLAKTDEYPIEKSFTGEYPASQRPISVDDKNPHQFYLEFMNYLAKHLSWYFTAHPVSDDIGGD
jgi:hypothetical protein